jgi:hypothetical protein
VKGIAVTCGLAFLFTAVACGAQQTQKQSSPPNAASAGKPSNGSGDVNAAMRNVNYHLTDKIMVHIVSLNGKLTPKPDQMVVFDDRQSFGIDVDSAKVTLSTTSLTNDLNGYVFAKPDAPLKKLAATIEGDQLTVKGLLASKGGIPFSTTGTLAVTPEGMIRVHTTKVEALHLPVKGLMDMLGLDSAKLVNTNKVQGVSVDKDDLILDPQVILPPPQLRGRLTSIKIENGQIALAFAGTGEKGSGQPLTNNCGARNYLQFKGGTVRFGKLIMTDADLVLLDTEPADSFDFAIDHYKEQLVAGFSKMTQQGGLCVHMPDYDKIRHGTSPKKEARPTSAAVGLRSYGVRLLGFDAQIRDGFLDHAFLDFPIEEKFIQRRQRDES